MRPWNDDSEPEPEGPTGWTEAESEMGRWKSWMQAGAEALGDPLTEDFQEWWDGADAFAIVALWCLCCEIADADGGTGARLLVGRRPPV
jgi:hypothetical protein